MLFSCPPEGVRPAGDETGAASPTRFLPSCPPEGVRPAGDENGAASPTRFLPSCPPEVVRPAGDENGAASPTRFLPRALVNRWMECFSRTCKKRTWASIWPAKCYICGKL